jgi:hypothetical protein
MTQDQCTCTVTVSSEEVDAGADFTLAVSVTAPAKAKDDLRGAQVSIRDCNDAELTGATLAKSDDGTYVADDIVMAAPTSAGEYIYRVAVIGTDKDGRPQQRASAELRLTVKPHAALLNVWDVPSTVVAGERFKVAVGVKCSAGCDLRGQEFGIIDGDGRQVSTVKLGDLWPGSEALYFAEVEADAPPIAANHRWEIRTVPWDAELPHAAGSSSFVLRVVGSPDCEVAVEVVDKDQQTPINDACVVMHPYRATTDENGVAKLKVTKGQYDILVSGAKYLPISTTVTVSADLTTRAELEVEPPWQNPDEA